MLKVVVGYPNREQEQLILQRMSKTKQNHDVRAVMKPGNILYARKLIDEIYIDNKVQDYVVDLVMATREPEKYHVPVNGLIQYGVSPRATISLTLAAKAICISARTRLRHPPRRERPCTRCTATSAYHHLRSRGGRQNFRRHRINHSCSRPCALNTLKLRIRHCFLTKPRSDNPPPE